MRLHAAGSRHIGGLFQYRENVLFANFQTGIPRTCRLRKHRLKKAARKLYQKHCKWVLSAAYLFIYSSNHIQTYFINTVNTVHNSMAYAGYCQRHSYSLRLVTFSSLSGAPCARISRKMCENISKNYAELPKLAQIVLNLQTSKQACLEKPYVVFTCDFHFSNCTSKH